MINNRIVTIILSVMFTTLSVALIVSAADWFSPAGPPPGNNVETPINIGKDAQFKRGGLIVGLNLEANQVALRIPYGKVGIGTFSPTEKLDVNGNVKANDFCLQDGFCLSALKPKASVGAVTISGGAYNGPEQIAEHDAIKAIMVRNGVYGSSNVSSNRRDSVARFTAINGGIFKLNGADLGGVITITHGQDWVTVSGKFTDTWGRSSKTLEVWK